MGKTLIILYGDFSNKPHWKQQRMIDGGATCGYREYARNYGHIVYLAPQRVSLPWEHSITNPKGVIQFINQFPDSIIWSVKHSPKKDSKILSKISNKKIYYSCNASNRYNKFCNISLVDTEARLKGNKTALWFKGKDPNFWKPVVSEKGFDYLLVGGRGDKNEVFFLNQLNQVKEKRKILWIGGEKFKHRIKSNHIVKCTPFSGQNFVRDNISRCKVGILFTELKIEGFPQTFLEMTMCGVPVVFNKKMANNNFYFHKGNCLLTNKKHLVESAESLLKNYDSDLCRKIAIKYYSLDKSYERILSCLK